MKKLILTALAALTATASAPAMADKWYLYASSSDDLVWLYLNLDSIKCNNDVCSLWDGDVNIDPKKPYDTRLMRYTIDCIEYKAKALYAVKYLKGKLIKSGDISDRWWYPIPGSVGERLVDSVCKPSSRDQELIFNFDSSLPSKAEALQQAMREVRDNYRKNK
jgi:hypothetical protein